MAGRAARARGSARGDRRGVRPRARVARAARRRSRADGREPPGARAGRPRRRGARRPRAPGSPVTPVALHHVVDGDGPVLLLGPSLGSTTAMWEPQVAPLAERFRVVRYDHRGHGGSPVPDGSYDLADLGGDVLALLDTLGAQR